MAAEKEAKNKTAAANGSNGESSSSSSSISLNDWRKQSGLTCSFIIFAALNVAFMYVGITNLHSCPVEKMVPIYLVGKSMTKVLSAVCDHHTL